MNQENMHALPGVDSALDRRKKALLDEGVMYRAKIISARQEVSEGLSAEALTKAAVNHAVHLAYTGLGRMVASKGLNLRSLIPVVIGGVSFLGRRALLWPVLKGGLAIAVAVAVARFAVRRKNEKKGRASFVR